MRYCIDLYNDTDTNRKFHECLHNVIRLGVRYYVNAHCFHFYSKEDRILAKLTVFNESTYNEYEFKI